MNPIDQLKSVLCGPEGKCCIAGSDEDRSIVDRALQALAEPTPVQEPASHQYQREDGKWCDFMNEQHFKNTVKDGRWPIRALYTSPKAQQPAPVQEPVAWWKQYPDGGISIVESRTFLADDAVATGWSALRFADTAPQAQQPAPQAQQPRKAVKLTYGEVVDAISSTGYSAEAEKYHTVANAIQDAFIAKNRIEQ